MLLEKMKMLVRTQVPDSNVKCYAMLGTGMF